MQGGTHEGLQVWKGEMAAGKGWEDVGVEGRVAVEMVVGGLAKGGEDVARGDTQDSIRCQGNTRS